MSKNKKKIAKEEEEKTDKQTEATSNEQDSAESKSISKASASTLVRDAPTVDSQNLVDLPPSDVGPDLSFSLFDRLYLLLGAFPLHHRSRVASQCHCSGTAY